MAKKTYHLWTNVEGNRDVKVGDEVTASSLGLDDDTFKVWVEEGIVRPIPHPCPTSTDVSPVEHMRRQVATLADESQVDNYLEVVSPEYKASSEATAQAEADVVAGEAVKS